MAVKSKKRKPEPLTKTFGSVALLMFLTLVAIYYPSDQDVVKASANTTQYYQDAYSRETAGDDTSLANERYVKIAKAAAELYDVKGGVERFVRQYGVKGAKALEVGAGRGYLQDVVENYTGLDLSPSAQRFFHKPFVAASATAMPFADSAYDAVWSVWVLEHIPEVEQALREIRRVTKNGGLIYLRPAWDLTPFLAEGYEVRPFSDFDTKGKAIKAALPALKFFQGISVPFTRTMRAAVTTVASGPTRLQYRRLDANYAQYWQPDTDAVNSLDRYEMGLWFRSRGDECLNCGRAGGLLNDETELIIRVRK